MPGFRVRAQQDRLRAAGVGREAAEGEEEVSQCGQGHHCGVNKGVTLAPRFHFLPMLLGRKKRNKFPPSGACAASSFVLGVSERVRGLPDMMSTEISDILNLPPCPHLDMNMIYTIEFTQPPLLRPLFHDPLPSPHL